jgi:hypothetical protein
MEEIIVPQVDLVEDKENLGNQVLLALMVMLQIIAEIQEILVDLVTLVIQEIQGLLETQVI